MSALDVLTPHEKASVRAAGIEVRGLSVTYPNGFTAVYDASFELGPGTICALVGLNGSGKSTIFKAIMGLAKPSAGEVRLCGMPVDEAVAKNLVAYVPQSEDVDWNFPVLVETVVMMGRYGHMNFLRIPGAADRQAVSAALERVGIFTVESYLSSWRIAVVVIFAISMFLTPADPGSMLMMALPLTGLYFLGIWLCKKLPRGESLGQGRFD